MATASNPKHTNKFKAILIGLGLFGLFELVALFVAVGAGNSYEESLSYFTAVHVEAIALACGVVPSYIRWKRAGGATQPAAKPMSGWRGWVLSLLWLILLIGPFIGWHVFIFPKIVNVAMQHNGVDATAVITENTYYQWQGSGRGGSYVVVRSLDQADSMQITILYSGHISTIFIHKDDDDFWPVYSDLQSGDHKLSVRYLRQLPSLVRITAVDIPSTTP